jgi:hypothetical protein
MLRTQIARTFYLCNSFFLAAIPFTGNPAHSHAVSFTDEKMGMETSLYHRRHEAPQIKLNRKEALFVKKYIKNSGGNLEVIKTRSAIPFYIIDSVFNRYGLPPELKYLAVIESELKPSALSHVGARGPWQLMPSTARDLGLKVTRQCDERINYYKSTRAAALYLRDLYVQFDDWLLVLAAYNGGPKPVFAAIRESGSKNFWVLQDYLPEESRDHVKKFIATHYFFEGRGSVTTLTKAENIKYRNTVNKFLKSNAGSEISASKAVKPANSLTDGNRKNPEVYYSMRQQAGSENERTDNSPQITRKISVPVESPEEKFRRVMKESEESLARSRKII